MFKSIENLLHGKKSLEPKPEPERLLQLGECILSDRLSADQIRQLLEAGEAIRFVSKGDFVVLTRAPHDSLIERLGIKVKDFAVLNGEFWVDFSKKPQFRYYMDDDNASAPVKEKYEQKIREFLKQLETK
ncbi:MAG: hypothetical protein WCT44_00965 [Candidatus Paceibacterota bacterium]